MTVPTEINTVPPSQVWTQRIIGLIFALIFLWPLTYLILRQASLFVVAHEFIGYRFFAALSLFNGEYENVFLVQGYPSGILQNILIYFLIEFLSLDPASIRDLDIYAYSVLFIAYLLGSIVIFLCWVNNNLSNIDKITFSFFSLVPTYLLSFNVFIIYPDYFVFEISFYMASALYLISQYRARRCGGTSTAVNRRLPMYRVAILLGAWAAIGFTLKISAGGICLPIALLLLQERRRKGLFLLISAVSFSFVVMATVSLYFLGNVIEAYYSLWDLAGIIGTQFKLDFSSVFDALFNTRADSRPYRLVIYTGMTTLVMTTLLLPFNAIYRRDRSIQMIIVGLFLAVMGYLYLLYMRPSSTSLYDLFLFSLMVIPICGAIVPRGYRLMLVAGFALTVLGTPFGMGRTFDYTRYGEAKETLIKAHKYVRSLDRPVALLIPNNTMTAQPLLQVALFHGRLGMVPVTSVVTTVSPHTVRGRFFGNSYVIGASEAERSYLRRIIRDGYAIMWAELPGFPAMKKFYPELDALGTAPNAVIRKYSHNALWPGRHLFIGYLDVPPKIIRVEKPFTAKRIDPTTIRITWQHQPGARHYRLEMLPENGVPVVVATLQGGNTNWSVSDVSAEHAYEFHLYSCRAASRCKKTALKATVAAPRR